MLVSCSERPPRVEEEQELKVENCLLRRLYQELREVERHECFAHVGDAVQHVSFCIHHVAGLYVRHNSFDFNLTGTRGYHDELFLGMTVRRVRSSSRLKGECTDARAASWLVRPLKCTLAFAPGLSPAAGRPVSLATEFLRGHRLVPFPRALSAQSS
jgi:hypothetical protein